MSKPVITVEGVSKKYCRTLRHTMLYGITDLAYSFSGIKQNRNKLRDAEFWAIDNVDCEIKQGETVGLIGANGSGKSTLLKMLNGIFMPDKGKISVKGAVGALIEVGAGFHPMLTGRENIYINAAILGMNKKQIDKKLEEIIHFSGVEEFIDMPVKHYSSGMHVRLGFAIAAYSDSEVMIVDEVLAVGDMQFQKKCMHKMSELKSKNVTIILVSHNLYAIRVFCERCLWIRNGRIAGMGDSNSVVNQYSESTRALDESFFNTGYRKTQSLRSGTGDVRVINVRLLNSEGDEQNQFITGDTLTLEVTYFAKEKILRPSIGVAIYADGDDIPIRVTTSNTRWQGCSPASITGTGVISFSLKSLPLLPGNYFFRLSIKDEFDLIVYDWIENIIEFKVSGEDGNRGILKECGVLFYPGNWIIQ